MLTKIRKCTAVLAACCMAASQVLVFPERAAAEELPDFSVIGTVGDLTASETQAMAEVIYRGLENREEYIDIQDEGLPVFEYETEYVEALGCLYRTVVANYDVGVLTVKNTMKFTINQDGIQSIVPLYMVEADAYDAEYDRVMGMMDEIVSGVDDSWSASEKALYLHEWMAVHYNYDNVIYSTKEEQDLCHTAYGMLLRNQAVCEGYAWLYGLLLRRVGVESMMVTSLELNHAWNLLQIGDAWYHVDITWDDFYAGHPGLVSHDSFLKGSDAIQGADHECTDWVLTTGKSVDEMNVSDKFDKGFWVDSQSVITPYVNGRWLAIRPDEENPTTGWFSSCAFDESLGMSVVYDVMSLDEKWFVYGNSTLYYAECYITAYYYDGFVFYTTPDTIFAMPDMNISGIRWLFDLTEEQKANGSIYGMHIEDDTLYYYVSKNPNAAAREYAVPLSELKDQLYPTETTTETTTTEETTAESTTVETTTEETTAESTTVETTTEESTAESTTVETTTEESTTESTTVGTTTEETTTESTTVGTTTEETTTESTTVETTTEETTTESTTVETTTEETTTESTTVETTTEETTTESTTVGTTTEETTVESTTVETATTEETTTTEPEDPVKYGDVNGDDVVSVVDVVTLQRYLLGQITLTEDGYACADMTRDSRVNGFDLAWMKRTLMQWLTL